MDYNRRIMISYPFNGSDSFHACPGVYYYGDCITSLPPSSSSRGSTDQHPNRHINNFFIASGCLLAGAFFLALTYYAVFNHRWRRRRRPIAGGGGGSFVEEGDRDRHACYIRSAGLDEATIESIAVYEYKAEDGLLPAADCSVCLGEFRDGELVRLLPNCGHAFHVPCIDTWLQAHVNCPLCRAEIATPTADPADPPPPSRPAEWDSGSYDAQSNTQLGTQPLESDRGASEGEGEEGGMESGIRVVIRSSKSSSCPPSRVPSDVGGGELQPVRRSVSMILSPLRSVSPTVEPEESRRGGGKGPAFGEDDSSKNRGKQGSASRETSLQKGPQEMGKSQSSSGRGLLFSKYGRSRSSNLLPL